MSEGARFISSMTKAMFPDCPAVRPRSGPQTELYFEKGKRISSLYETPYGPMELEVLTRSVINRLDTAEYRGNVDIEYHVSLSGMAESKNRLTIDIQ